MKSLSVTQARELLLSGEVVSIPTETVYGLAGWIFSQTGLRKIFSTKERPFFDPLIVHIDSIKKAIELTAEWTDIHNALAEATWPGPLTLIAKKNDRISPLITSGLDSVGLRCPRHPKTLELLRLIEGGVAAPSANKFGKTSPTSVRHVEQEFNGLVPILEGGPSEIGIESTVAGIEDGKILIYRPGFYSAKMLKEILFKKGISIEVSYAENPVAPGQLKHHYMPRIPLIIVPEGFNWKMNGSLTGLNYQRPVFWEQPSTPDIASRELYQKMREFDEQGYDIIFAEKKKLHNSEEWLAIWNRLEKAKTKSFDY